MDNERISQFKKRIENMFEIKTMTENPRATNNCYQWKMWINKYERYFECAFWWYFSLFKANFPTRTAIPWESNVKNLHHVCAEATSKSHPNFDYYFEFTMQPILYSSFMVHSNQNELQYFHEFLISIELKITITKVPKFHGRVWNFFSLNSKS